MNTQQFCFVMNTYKVKKSIDNQNSVKMIGKSWKSMHKIRFYWFNKLKFQDYDDHLKINPVFFSHSVLPKHKCLALENGLNLCYHIEAGDTFNLGLESYRVVKNMFNMSGFRYLNYTLKMFRWKLYLNQTFSLLGQKLHLAIRTSMMIMQLNTDFV